MLIERNIALVTTLWFAITTAAACTGAAPQADGAGNDQADQAESGLVARRLCAGPRGLRCPATQFCNGLSTGLCPGPAQFGVCATKPQVCTDIFDPVCGCDGETHGNACEASAAGVAVSSKGACETTGAFCGGIAGIPCPDGQVCVDDPSDDCDPRAGGADCGGICTSKSDPCASVRCPSGTQCVADGESVRCAPTGGACGDTVCPAGTQCCNPLMSICTRPGMVCIL